MKKPAVFFMPVCLGGRSNYPRHPTPPLTRASNHTQAYQCRYTTRCNCCFVFFCFSLLKKIHGLSKVLMNIFTSHNDKGTLIHQFLFPRMICVLIAFFPKITTSCEHLPNSVNFQGNHLRNRISDLESMFVTIAAINREESDPRSDFLPL